MGQIKTRIWMMLEEHTRDGVPAQVDHTHLADIRQRMPDAIDTVQRKIALCGRKLKRETKLVFALPPVSGDVLAPGRLSGGVRIPIPAGAATYSLTLRGGDAALRFLSLPEEGEVLLEERGLSCGWGEERRFSGFVPGGADVLDLEGEGSAPELVFYSAFFHAERLIPPAGYSSCPLPGDIMAVRSLRRADGHPAPAEMREEGGVLLLRGEGEYILSYERYPGRVDAYVSDETEMEMDDLCCDALVHGAAYMLCPLDRSSLYLKLRGMFEESMANLYNSSPLGDRVSDSMFAGRRKRGGI